MKNRIVVLAAGVFLSLVAPATSRAQVLYGSIVGNVRDASGGVLPGATVIVINADSKQSRQTTTSAAGAYSIATLTSGAYQVTVSAPGFANFTDENVQVAIN